MQLVVSGNRILAHGSGFLAMGGTVINTDTGRAYQNATVVECDSCPADLDKVGYEYHAGQFVPCAPFGVGDGNLAVVCGEDCKSIKDSGFSMANVRDMYNKIALIMEDVAEMNLTVVSSSGVPLAGVIVNGLVDEDGNAAVTNASGVAVGLVAEGSTTLSVSQYGDIEDYSETISVVKGEAYNKTITLKTRNFLKLTSSKSLKFSGNVTQVDVTAVGGGGGGGSCRTWASSYGEQRIYTGGGGGGGSCVVREDVSFDTNNSYPAVVGAGGEVDVDGGSSSFLGVFANGGSKGYNGSSGGGSGNGRGGHGVDYLETNDDTRAQGGNGVSGSAVGYSSFADTVIYGGGGGAGSGGSFTAGGIGAGYGGNGSAVQYRTDYPGTSGQDGFGGGGGGAGGNVYSNDYELCAGTRGGSGCIAIRMHLKTA